MQEAISNLLNQISHLNDNDLVTLHTMIDSNDPRLYDGVTAMLHERRPDLFQG
jgi:hypothetical protein